MSTPLTISDWAKHVHDIARAKGWHDRPVTVETVCTWIALIHSEASEALEDVRKGGPLTMRFEDNGKPVGFESELADIVIRVFDTAEALGLDIERAIRVKSAYNETRSHKHGGKAV